MEQNEDISFTFKGVKYNYFNLGDYCKKKKYWDDDELYILQKHNRIIKMAIEIYSKKRPNLESEKRWEKIYREIEEGAKKINNVILPDSDSPYYIDPDINYDDMEDDC